MAKFWTDVLVPLAIAGAVAAQTVGVEVNRAIRLHAWFPQAQQDTTLTLPDTTLVQKDSIRSVIDSLAQEEDFDLFAENEITMINAWGTWCHACMGEMAELAEIHERLREKNCGIVGLEVEFDYDDETLDYARQALKEFGTNYPNVLCNDDMDFMNILGSYPTSIFVDKDGTILDVPIEDAAPNLYEPQVDFLLKAKAAESK